MRRRTLLHSAWSTGLAAALPARAQTAPTALPETFRLIVGYPPGGSTDTLARQLAEALAGVVARTVIVENRPGAAGQIGLAALKQGPADGSVAILTPASPITVHPYTYRQLPFDPRADFQPVSIVAHTDHAFGVGPMVPATVHTFKDYLAWTAAPGGATSYGSVGAGSIPHLVVAYLSGLAGRPLQHVPYRGSAPGLQELLGGHLAGMSSPVGDYLPYRAEGKLRVIGVSAPRRSAFAPDVPTYREQGFPIDTREWYAVLVPRGVAAARVRQLNDTLRTAMQAPAIAAVMSRLGLAGGFLDTDASLATIATDSEQWRKIVADVGFSTES